MVMVMQIRRRWRREEKKTVEQTFHLWIFELRQLRNDNQVTSKSNETIDEKNHALINYYMTPRFFNKSNTFEKCIFY